MALELHPKLRQRLRDLLVEALKAASVSSGSLLDRVDLIDHLIPLDDALPDTGTVFEQLDNVMGSFPALTFFTDEIANALTGEKYNPEEANKPLTDIPRFSKPDEYADTLLDEFERLPWPYTLTFELPQPLSDFLALFIDEQPLGKLARLKKVDAGFRERFPLKGGGKGLLGALLASELKDGSVVLQVEIDGFIRSTIRSTTAKEAVVEVRSIIGLAMALGLLEDSSRYGDHTMRTARVHDRRTEPATAQSPHDLSYPESRLFGGIAIAAGLQKASLEGRQAFAKSTFKTIDQVFSHPAQAGSIILASKWFADAAFGSDPLLNYVQSTMVLEILLGDKATSDEVGLGKLLANRCAYLIGRSQAHRARILKQFADIYSVRSQIVHRGKRRFSRQEERSFDQLKALGRQVIAEETKMFTADVR